MCITSQVYATNSVIFQGKTFQCDKVYESRTLRANHGYSLKLNFYNRGDTAVIIKSYKVNFDGMNYGDAPTYQFTDWIKAKKGIIEPKETGEILYSSEYRISRIPEKRAFDNLLVRYDTGYKTVSNGKEIGFTKPYISCQPYAISWCGDGVLEQEYDEMCDPADPQKQGWGLGGCNPKTCQPIEQKTVVDLLKQKSLVLDRKLPNIKPI